MKRNERNFLPHSPRGDKRSRNYDALISLAEEYLWSKKEQCRKCAACGKRKEAVAVAVVAESGHFADEYACRQCVSEDETLTHGYARALIQRGGDSGLYR